MIEVNSMFNLIKGAKINDNIQLKEEYQIDGSWVSANVSAEKIRNLFDEFIKNESTELYCLFIELPANADDENVIGITEEGIHLIDKSYKNVYYLDDISATQLKKLLDIFDEILINDGLSGFGVLSQRGNELGKYKYNVINAYSDGEDISPFIKILNSFGITKTDNLVTAWDYFSQDNPGESELYKKDGKTIYDIVETLEEIGMYKYEQYEE